MYTQEDDRFQKEGHAWLITTLKSKERLWNNFNHLLERVSSHNRIWLSVNDCSGIQMLSVLQPKRFELDAGDILWVDSILSR